MTDLKLLAKEKGISMLDASFYVGSKTRVLWFSRHIMTPDQLSALEEKLGHIEVVQISGTAPNVHVPFTDSDGVEQKPLKELINDFDVVAAVLPVHLKQQILPFCGEKPLIEALNRRTIIKGEDGQEDKVEFVFDGWQRVIKIEVVTEPF